MDREQQLLDQLAGDASVLQVDEPADAVEGTCWYCGCTEDKACIVPMGNRGRRTSCSWYRRPDHRGFGVCTNPECVKAYLADPGAP